MQPIELKPGMRVRCVDDAGFIGFPIRKGSEYRLTATNVGACFVNVEGVPGNFLPQRFKPVIRVKMRAKPSLDILIKRTLASFDKMSPAEKDAHFRAQRESWVRGEMGLD